MLKDFLLSNNWRFTFRCATLPIFQSSRTLPGQSCFLRASKADGEDSFNSSRLWLNYYGPLAVITPGSKFCSGTLGVGTEGYIPPGGGGGTQGGLFALGKVLCEALTGASQTPLLESFEGGNAPHSTDLYWRLLNIALRACASDPKDGYSSAAALNRALKDILIVTGPNITGHY